MKHFQRICKNGLQGPKCCCFCGILVIVKSWFYHFNIPVTELFPDEIINLLNCNTKLIFIQVLCYIFCQSVYLGQNPLISAGKGFQISLSRNLCFFQIHHNKSGCIPYLICKVSAGFHTFHVETHIISGSISGHQGKTQSICSILVNDFQRVDTISKGFTHFPSLGISHQTMNQYVMEWCFSDLLQT